MALLSLPPSPLPFFPSGIAPPFGLLLLLLVLSLFWLFIFRKKHLLHQFPPGPPPLPLIGNFAQIDLANPHRSFVAWKHRYGPIFTVWLPKPQVVVAGSQELDELFASAPYADKFADRPTHSFLYGLFSKHQLDGDGLLDELWLESFWPGARLLKKIVDLFALSAFRQLGMGRPRMEARIDQQRNELVRRLAEKATKGDFLDDLPSQLSFCIGNIIHHMVMGSHYVYNDEKFIHFKCLLDHVVKEISGVQLLLVDTFPWIRFLFPAFWRYRRAGFAIQEFFLEEIEWHIERMEKKGPKGGGNNNGPKVGEDDSQPDNFIDAFLEAAREEGQNWHDSACKLTLALCAGDLWAGGLETLVTSLTWAIIYLLHYPEVQEKLHHHLSDHLCDRAFQLSHNKDLPYLRAFIDELLRVVNVLPWNLPHSLSQQVVLRGQWTIPKDTLVMPQLGAVLLDPEVFPDPEIFRPERFLDPHGNYMASEWMKPFGVGKRRCLGEALAKMELPLILAALVQNFEFRIIEVGKPPSLHRNPGLASTPDPFKCIIRSRVEEPILSYCVPTN